MQDLEQPLKTAINDEDITDSWRSRGEVGKMSKRMQQGEHGGGIEGYLDIHPKYQSASTRTDTENQQLRLDSPLLS